MKLRPRIIALILTLTLTLLLHGGYYSSVATITTSGTAVALSSATPTLPTSCISLTVQTVSTNVGTVYLGGSNVSAANKIGLALSPSLTPPSSAYWGPSSTNALYSPGAIYVDSTSSGDKVNITCYK